MTCTASSSDQPSAALSCLCASSRRHLCGHSHRRQGEGGCSGRRRRCGPCRGPGGWRPQGLAGQLRRRRGLLQLPGGAASQRGRRPRCGQGLWGGARLGGPQRQRLQCTGDSAAGAGVCRLALSPCSAACRAGAGTLNCPSAVPLHCRPHGCRPAPTLCSPQVGEVIGEAGGTQFEVYATHGKGVFSSVLRARDLSRRDHDSGNYHEVAIKVGKGWAAWAVGGGSSRWLPAQAQAHHQVACSQEAGHRRASLIPGAPAPPACVAHQPRAPPPPPPTHPHHHHGLF